MKIEKKSQAWMMWFCCSIFLAYQYVLRVIPNILVPELMERLNVEATKIGQISGCYYIGYAMMHIPLGILLDRGSIKHILPLFVLLASVGTLPLIYADSWQMVALGRLLVGIGSSAAILGLFKIIRMGFRDDQFSFMLGISITIGFSGALYAGRPMLELIKIFGYKETILLLVMIGVTLSLLLFSMTPKYKREMKGKYSVKEDIKEVLTDSRFIILCLIGGFMVGPVEGFADTWSAEFLKKAYNLTKENASFYPSIIFLGMCFGAPSLAFVADKTRSYMMTLFVCAMGMGVGLFLVLFYNISLTSVAITFAIIGVLSSYQTIVIYKASNFVSEDLRSLASACANMIIMVFGYVFHNFIGMTMDIFWHGEIFEGKRVYSVEAYKYGLSVVPTASIIAGLALIVFVCYIRKSSKTGSYN